MPTPQDDVGVPRPTRDRHEPLRLRLSGRTLPKPRPVAGELQEIVSQRVIPMRAERSKGRRHA